VRIAYLGIAKSPKTKREYKNFDVKYKNPIEESQETTEDVNPDDLPF